MDHTLTPPPEGILDSVNFGQLPVKTEPVDSAMPPKKNTEAPASQEDSPDKKQTKKRKSWGQVLPEPKTNLPPRKRAKTEDEKEQRRVERVLRNRRAAQSSRERKRQETEALEQQNQELRKQLEASRLRNEQVAKALQELQQSGAISAANPIFASAIDLSSQAAAPMIEPQHTVDPSALSPLAEEDFQETSATPETSSAAIISPVPTQCPAETLFDLPCPGPTEMSPQLRSSHLRSQPNSSCLSILMMSSMFLESLLSFTRQPLTQIALALRPNSSPGSIKSSPQILATLISVLTTRRTSRTSTTSLTRASLTVTMESTTATTVSSKTQPTPLTRKLSSSRTLRLRTLRKILTCNAHLARPLQDATLVAMRLLSEENLSSGNAGFASRGSLGLSRGTEEPQLVQCLRSINLPSRELLMTLYWAIHVESKRLASGSKSNVSEKRILKGSSSRRSANGREAAMKKKIQDRYRLGRRSAY